MPLHSGQRKQWYRTREFSYIFILGEHLSVLQFQRASIHFFGNPCTVSKSIHTFFWKSWESCLKSLFSECTLLFLYFVTEFEVTDSLSRPYCSRSFIFYIGNVLDRDNLWRFLLCIFLHNKVFTKPVMTACESLPIVLVWNRGYNYHACSRL